MYPQLHKPSTATPYDEARWLQFFKGSPKTEPCKPSDGRKNFPKLPTPPKISSIATLSSPVYPFTFGGASLTISPTARKELDDTKLEAATILKQLQEQKAKLEAEQTAARKIAKPKGRFSNAHNSAFMKMDSIANHASAWRANPSHAQPSLKRVASKIELDRPTASSALKRSPLKAELDAPELPRSLKRSPSKVSLIDSSDKDSSMIQEPSAKRVRRDIKPPGNYASPAGAASPTKPATPRTVPGARPARGAATPSSLGRRSNLLSPTASSLARARGARDLLSQRGGGRSRIPALPPRAPSAVDLLRPPPPSPPRVAVAARQSPLASPGRMTPIKPAPVASLGQISPISKMPSLAPRASFAPPKASPEMATPAPSMPLYKAIPKSILRSPTRLYSTDPSKIAAGTHLATPTPPRASASSRLPTAAAAAEPASERGARSKHVDFSASARLKALRDEAKAAEAKAAAAAPYPDLSARADEAVAEAARGDFTFRATSAIRFAGASTIRAVRDDCDGDDGAEGSPAAAPRAVAGVKRKLSVGFAAREDVEGDKENEAEDEDEGEERPAKKMRRGTAGPRLGGAADCGAPAMKKKTVGASGTGKKRAAAQAAGRRILTAARLNYLARPKRAA